MRSSFLLLLLIIICLAGRSNEERAQSSSSGLSFNSAIKSVEHIPGTAGAISINPVHFRRAWVHAYFDFEPGVVESLAVNRFSPYTIQPGIYQSYVHLDVLDHIYPSHNFW